MPLKRFNSHFGYAISMGKCNTILGACTKYRHRVFHDPLVSLNFKGFDPQIFLNDPQNVLFTFFNSYGGHHCDPLNRKLRENPVGTRDIIALI